MIFHFVKIMDDLKLFHQKTPKICFDDAIFLGQFFKCDTKNMGGRLIFHPLLDPYWTPEWLPDRMIDELLNECRH